MTKTLGQFVCVLLAALPIWTAEAAASGLRWDIDRYDVDISVGQDGELGVLEHIVVDFSREPHHGIFRKIPYRYQRHGTDFRLRIAVQSVADDSGTEYRYETWREDDRLIVKIGDPDRKVRGLVTYRIRYTVRRALLAFDTHDELYWNAIGTEWAVPMAAVSSTVRLPDGVPAEDVRVASFTGPYGSAQRGPDGVIGDDGSIRFADDRGLKMREGMTIVVGWPKGHVRTPDASTRLGWFLADNSVLLVPFAVFGLLWAAWHAFGRDRGTPRSVTVQYEPPDGLTPAEVGTIIDERVHMRDLTAAIIDLAVRGHVRINDLRPSRRKKLAGKHLELVRVPNAGDQLRPFEKLLLDKLFGTQEKTTVHDLKNVFYAHVDEIRSAIYGRLAAQGYFDGHLGIRRTTWMVGALVTCVATIGAGILLTKLDVFAPLSVVIAAALTVPQFPFFAYAMPRKTAKGRRALEDIRGLSEYIERAEIESLDSHAARGHFERLLPHAIALDLSREWGDHFQDLYTEPPQWYGWPPHSRFTAGALTADLGRSATLLHTNMTARPRASGSGFSSGGSGFSGGFSGGGGGGGGGGAW